jgi:hypothetical protein
MEGPDEVVKSFQIVMRFIAELSLDLEALRCVVLANGSVTQEELTVARNELERRWGGQVQPLIEQIRDRRTLEALQRLIDEGKSKPQ